MEKTKGSRKRVGGAAEVVRGVSWSFLISGGFSGPIGAARQRLRTGKSSGDSVVGGEERGVRNLGRGVLLI